MAAEKTRLNASMLVVLATVGAWASQGTAASFSDGDFASGWSNTVTVTDDIFTGGTGPGTSTGSISLQGSGGNPGAYRYDSFNLAAGDALFVGGLNSTAVYDPSTQGAIARISFGADLFMAQGGSSAYQLIIEQGGQTFYSVPWTAFAGGGWTHYAASDLTSASFDLNPWVGNGATAGAIKPDFSSGGSAMTFGYAIGNRIVGGSVGTFYTLNHGIDNWTVNVSEVPAPAAAWLIAPGAGLLMPWVKRRARK